MALLRELSRRGRVIYQRNPLVEVVAAVQFPPLLRLVQEVPKELQVRLGREYPLTSYMEATGQIALPDQRSDGVPQQFPSSLRTTTFSSVDKFWTISVGSTLLGLTCTKYSEWSQFRGRLSELLRVFGEIYELTIATRFGLRYKDVISKRDLGVIDSPWHDLIRPEVLASFEFFTADLDSNPAALASIQLAIPPGKVNISLGTVTNIEKQIGFLIDTDCYIDQIGQFDLDSLLKNADELHEYTSIVFQSCITDFLHDRLEPLPPSSEKK